MSALFIEAIEASTLGSPPDEPVSAAAQEGSKGPCSARLRRTSKTGQRSKPLQTRFDRWGCLMADAQRGETDAYEQLIRELDAWLRRYYARRLPHAAAEDARQEALLAVHAGQHGYETSRSFGPWIVAIARYKWIDCIRESSRQVSRFTTLAPHLETLVENHEDAVINAIEVKTLLGRLAPPQAAVIRLVKLEGASINGASRMTGQSTALVKVNIHRGLRRLASLVACESEASKLRPARLS